MIGIHEFFSFLLYSHRTDLTSLNLVDKSSLGGATQIRKIGCFKPVRFLKLSGSYAVQNVT
jgi:hypothetical protein